MNISVCLAQFPVSLNVQDNLESMQSILRQAKAGDLVLLPEGAVSGYSNISPFVDKIDSIQLSAALDTLCDEARKRKIHLWAGACVLEKGQWRNAAFGFSPKGERYLYYKVNLANSERGTFTAGSKLPVFQLEMQGSIVNVGIQMCRELRYPEQWGWLARQGAQIILHLNNAVSTALAQPIWRSHLISRAAETQRFVVSANNAAPTQNCPTIAIAPSGEILGELLSDQPGVLRVNLDLSLVSDLNLSQCRTDLVEICSPTHNSST